MGKNTNILILSCGTRNKIVQYFRKELNGKGLVFATDCSPLAPALYEADKYFIVPSIDKKNYLETILTICKDNNIDGVFTLIDPELTILASHYKKFKDVGTTPIVSSVEAVELSFNKFAMNEFLRKEGFNAIKSYIDKKLFYDDLNIGIIDFPVFVKPIDGSASININKVNNQQELETLFNKYNDLMIQEFVEDKEIGADVYIDFISNEVVAIFTKEKLLMRAGETDKAVSIKDEKLFDLIKTFVSRVGFKGVIDIDIFKKNNKYFISEVNPRFGGGYPHAYECNVNIPKMILNNLEGKINKKKHLDYDTGVFMMKYNEIMVQKL